MVGEKPYQAQPGVARVRIEVQDAAELADGVHLGAVGREDIGEILAQVPAPGALRPRKQRQFGRCPPACRRLA